MQWGIDARNGITLFFLGEDALTVFAKAPYEITVSTACILKLKVTENLSTKCFYRLYHYKFTRNAQWYVPWTLKVNGSWVILTTVDLSD